MSSTRTEPSATQWRDGAVRSREWAASWAADAELRQLIAPIDAAGTLADLVPAALALLHEPGWFEAMVAQWLAIIVATPLAEPPVRSSRDAARRTLLLHDGATATITATVLSDGVAPPARAGAGRVVRSGRWRRAHRTLAASLRCPVPRARTRPVARRSFGRRHRRSNHGATPGAAGAATDRHAVGQRAFGGGGQCPRA